MYGLRVFYHYVSVIYILILFNIIVYCKMFSTSFVLEYEGTVHTIQEVDTFIILNSVESLFITNLINVAQ